ncbi:aspartic peptidase domain-containing protein [Chiua virens]|nr:aspartic peptidase domain-containing protein [Chiua virens]
MRLSLLLSSGIFALVAPSYASHLPLSGRLGYSSPNLGRRTAMSGTLSQLNDSQNLVYTTNVSFNGSPFSIMIDTGSADLWVSRTVPDAVPQDFQAGVTYASGSAAGDVMSATFDFAGFSIQSQYFIEAPAGDAAAGADGLIGLGPSSGSTIRGLGNSSAANPPLDRIFMSNASVSPILAILLQRSDDPDEPYPGDLAIGEVLSDYKDILNQPQHPVTIAPLAGGQHWQTLLDVNGIIGPDGKPIEIKTQVTGAQTQNATVIFDTGFSLPQVPSYVAEALYGAIPNSVLTNVSSLGEIWVLPCDQEVNATFLFGGVEFPIHPLDLNFDGLGLQQDGQTACVGAFQPFSFDIEQDGEILFDMVLGMAFLRNAYMLIDFGNMVNAATPSTDTAYIQLLPITNATQAAEDFASVRNGTGDGSGNSDGNLLSSSSGSKSSHKKTSTWVIIVVVAVCLVLLLLVCGAIYYRRRRARNASVPSGGWVATAPQANYQPIYEPSPQAAYDIHMAPQAAHPGYTPAYVPEYKTAWDAHY